MGYPPIGTMRPFHYLLFLTFCFGCSDQITGSGDVVERPVPVPNFDNVSICCGIETTIVMAQQTSAVVEGEDNIVSELLFKATPEGLEIRFDEGMDLTPTRPVRLALTTPGLVQISAEGGVQASITGFQQDTLQVNGDGANVVLTDMMIANLNLDLRRNGGAVVSDSGVERVQAELVGGSYFSSVMTQSETLTLSDASRASVWCEGALDVTAREDSHVKYYGDPTITRSLDGNSSLERFGDQP